PLLFIGVAAAGDERKKRPFVLTGSNGGDYDSRSGGNVAQAGVSIAPVQQMHTVRRIRGLTMTAEAEFWEQAARQGLPRFRFFRRPLAPERLGRELLGTFLEAEWRSLKARIQPGDQIWPFNFHVRRYLGMRRGYLVLRQGRPVGGVVTEVS